MWKRVLPLGIFLGLMLISAGIVWRSQFDQSSSLGGNLQDSNFSGDEDLVSDDGMTSISELNILSQRAKSYPGSQVTIEKKLPAGDSFDRFIASYQSEDLTIYGLLAVPRGNAPQGGWPILIFNHGYIAPEDYVSTQKYVAYVAALARAGYVVYMSDYRGHGESEGDAAGGYGSTAYTTDVLNALASLKTYPGVNPEKIGMWGHSMGGFITLRSMVISSEIDVGVIWAGVVASYPDLLNNWRRSSSTPPPLPSGARRWREVLTTTFGAPEQNPTFWDGISANAYLEDLSGPLQLHHATGDTSVPVEFSQTLAEQLTTAGKEHELYVYQGDDHNISSNFTTAMRRTIEYFDRVLKE